MNVIGVHKDHVGVSVPASQWEFAMQEAFAKQDRFVFQGRRLSNVEIALEQAGNFKLPDLLQWNLPGSLPAAASHDLCSKRTHGKPLSARRKQLGGRVALIQA